MTGTEGMDAGWSPGADAEAVGVCPVCGHAVYQGDRIYWGHGTDFAVGCEYCVDELLA